MTNGRDRSIVFLCASYGTGGMETCLNVLAEGLVKRGFSVIFILGELRKEHIPLPKEVDVHVLNRYVKPDQRTVFTLTSSFLNARKKLAKIVRVYSKPIFICMDMYPAWVCYSLRFKPLFLWLHFSIDRVFAVSKTWVVNRFLIRAADAVVVLGASMKEEIRNFFKEDVYKKTFIIPNPLTINHFGLQSLYSPGCNRFVYVGRLYNKQKRIDRMLKALSALKDFNWELVIVGDGSDREYLVDLARTLRISNRVSWAGWQSNPWDYIKEKGGVEAVLLTSDYEGYPTVLVEAMANGIPCVAVDCPTGPGDIIQNGINGVLIPFTSDEQIVKDLSQVLKQFLDGKLMFDEDKIKASVVEHDPSMVVEKWIKLIEQYNR